MRLFVQLFPQQQCAGVVCCRSYTNVCALWNMNDFIAIDKDRLIVIANFVAGKPDDAFDKRGGGIYRVAEYDDVAPFRTAQLDNFCG